MNDTNNYRKKYYRIAASNQLTRRFYFNDF